MAAQDRKRTVLLDCERSLPESIPKTLTDVALVDAATAAGIGSMSTSWWHACVRDGRAPQPVLRGIRCTRWRVIDVARFWENLAEVAAAEPDRAERAVAQAKKASDRAKAKRAGHGGGA